MLRVLSLAVAALALCAGPSLAHGHVSYQYRLSTPYIPTVTVYAAPLALYALPAVTTVHYVETVATEYQPPVTLRRQVIDTCDVNPAVQLQTQTYSQGVSYSAQSDVFVEARLRRARRAAPPPPPPVVNVRVRVRR